ncbi:hypothetical protein Tco_0378026 [Tanacetum coccineum]
MNSIETFLKKFNRLSFRETPKVLLLAWEKFLEIKHGEKQHPPEDIQDLLHKLLEDVRNVNEELVEYINTPSWNRPAYYYEDDDEDTILEKESDEFIKSSVEDLIPILRESEDTSGSDSVCVLPSSNDFSPIFEEKSLTFSNPLFDSNDFTSSDNESLSDEDVSEDVKIYSNPLLEFDDEYISSDVNPLFDEVLEDIECKVSYDSNLDESTFLVTPLSDSNEDECLAPGDDIEFLLHHDPSTPIISIVSILEGFINEPPLKDNDDLFDLEPK